MWRPVAFLALFGVIFVLFAGCATTSPSGASYIRNGRQYGVTEGRFRGRWWSYYERGRSFADGEFWAEAEKDLRTAMSMRSRDQLWPRTYGLHFLPEYFPHRELGVILYHQGKLDEAAVELEQSYAFQRSSRAAWFLDEARRQTIAAAGGDATDPAITVESPAGGAAIGANRIVVSGSVRDDGYVKNIRVNGEDSPLEIASREASFSLEVTLNPGDNEITVEAVDLSGRVAVVTHTLAVDVDGPVTAFDSSTVQGPSISGWVNDASAVASVVIAGRPATLTPENGAIRFNAILEPEDLSSPEGIPYAATDSLGNVTAGIIASTLARTANLSWPLYGLPMILAGFQPALLGAVPDAGSPMIRFINLKEGQRLYCEDLVIALDIEADNPLAAVEVNGAPAQILPDRMAQSISRKLPLRPGPNVLNVTATDTQGRTSTATLTVQRAASPVDDIANRLSLAILGNVWKGNSPKLDDESGFITGMLGTALNKAKRFRMLDRDALPEILTEQQLSAALSAKENRIQLCQVIPAEVLCIGRVHRDSTSLEIVLEAIGTETNTYLVRADVAGKADTTDELNALTRLLAMRIRQELPRVRGQVISVGGSSDTAPLLAIAVESADKWTGAASIEVIRDAVKLELSFGQELHVVDRDNIGDVQQERDISNEIAADTARLAEGAAISARVLVSGQFTTADGVLTCALRAVDTETTEPLAQASAAMDAALPDAAVLAARKAARDLRTQLLEKAPAWSPIAMPNAVKSDMTTLNGVRPSMKCIVFREGEEAIDPITKQSLGRPVQLLGEALVRHAGNRDSVMGMVRGYEAGAAPVIKEGDLVITK